MTERVTPPTRSIIMKAMTLRNLQIPPLGSLQGYNFREINAGDLTAHSRAEVARITRRLGGRMKP